MNRPIDLDEPTKEERELVSIEAPSRVIEAHSNQAQEGRETKVGIAYD